MQTLPAHPTRLRAILAALVLVGGAPPALSQVQAGVSMGIFMPTRDPLVRQFGGVNGAPVSYPVVEKWQVGSMVFAGRLTRWTGGLLGIEATAGISPGRVASRDSTNRVRESPSSALMASVRLPVRLTRKTTGLLLFASPGVGYISYGGPAWAGFGSRGHPAGILAVGGRGQLGKRSRYWFRFDFEDWIARTAFNEGGVPLDRQLHHGINYSVGFVVQFGRRR